MIQTYQLLAILAVCKSGILGVDCDKRNVQRSWFGFIVCRVRRFPVPASRVPGVEELIGILSLNGLNVQCSAFTVHRLLTASFFGGILPAGKII